MIGNENGKTKKKFRKETEDMTEKVAIEREKGERKLSAQNDSYSRLSRQGILNHLYVLKTAMKIQIAFCVMHV